jgi:hypothetical protein
LRAGLAPLKSFNRKYGPTYRPTDFSAISGTTLLAATLNPVHFGGVHENLQRRRLAGGGFVSSTASAQPSIQVGPGGVRVDPDSDRYERRRYRRWERRSERCRTIVEQRRNRFGERVERRTRVCD